MPKLIIHLQEAVMESLCMMEKGKGKRNERERGQGKEVRKRSSLLLTLGKEVGKEVRKEVKSAVDLLAATS